MAVEMKRRGRPPKPAGEKKNVNFTFRARPDLREKLSSSAETSRRSISEEIERRLEGSYENPAADDSPTAVLIKAIAAVVLSTEKATGRPWQDDPITASLAGDLSRKVIETLLPPLPKIENKLFALAGRSTKEPDASGWDEAVAVHARDEVLRQLEAARDQRSAGLAETVAGEPEKRLQAKAKPQPKKSADDVFAGLSADVRERVEASAAGAGRTPAQQLNRLAEIGLQQSETLGDMSPNEYAHHLAGVIAQHMADAPSMTEIKNKSFEGQSFSIDDVVQDATAEVAHRRGLDPDTGNPV